MLRLTPHTYRQMALDCVAASVRVQSEWSGDDDICICTLKNNHYY